jgi:hypothetical protein
MPCPCTFWISSPRRVDLEDQRALVLVHDDVHDDVHAEVAELHGARGLPRGLEDAAPVRHLEAEQRRAVLGVLFDPLPAVERTDGLPRVDVEREPEAALVEVRLALRLMRGHAHHREHRHAVEGDDTDIAEPVAPEVTVYSRRGMTSASEYPRRNTLALTMTAGMATNTAITPQTGLRALAIGTVYAARAEPRSSGRLNLKTGRSRPRPPPDLPCRR